MSHICFKTCLFCRHFVIQPSEPALSDVTPGVDFSMTCRKDMWQWSATIATEENFRNYLITAERCEYFGDIAEEERKP